MNGILAINKPENYTSRDIVNIVGKKLNTKKIGHTGTLDPLASGVLVLCVGRYTKLVDMLTSLDKEYIAEIKLGIKTDTLDITGSILENEYFNITIDDIKKVFKNFIGLYEMEVPIYSAVKVNGKKLYNYARNNEEVILPKKIVNIYELELLDFKNDTIKFRTKVSKGTYIRSLIRDICKSLNTIGTMSSLVRTKQGLFRIDKTYTLEDIKNNNYVLSNIQDIYNLEEYNLNSLEYKIVKNGGHLSLPSNSKYLLMLYNKEEIAIYIRNSDIYKVYVMLKIA